MRKKKNKWGELCKWECNSRAITINRSNIGHKYVCTWSVLRSLDVSPLGRSSSSSSSATWWWPGVVVAANKACVASYKKRKNSQVFFGNTQIWETAKFKICWNICVTKYNPMMRFVNIETYFFYSAIFPFLWVSSSFRPSIIETYISIQINRTSYYINLADLRINLQWGLENWTR